MKKIISSILALLTFVVASSTVSETLAAEPIDFLETKNIVANNLQQQLADDDKVEDTKLTYELKNTTLNINFSELGIYSVYKKTNILPFFINSVVDKNKELVYSSALTNNLSIPELIKGNSYEFYVYEGNFPNDENFIKKIKFTIAPEIPKDISFESYSNKVIIKWSSVNNTDFYYIYRNGKCIATSKNNTFTDKDLKDNTVYQYQICSVSNDVKSAKSDIIETKTTKKYQAKVSGKCKTWANYQAVTDTSSPQYKLLNSDECYTDQETGIRMVDDCYCVALGSYYGSKIGQKYLIKLSSGNKFKAILCDQKSDRHTDEKHQYAKKNKDIIEFYIDKAYKPSCVDGSYNALSKFKGSVVSIEKIK